MMTLPLSDQRYRRALNERCIVRWSTAADTEGIADLYSYVFRENAESPLNQQIATWTRELMGGAHPLCTHNDFAVVEDQATGAIVAATALLWQEWVYEGIRFPVGRPEIVASHPDYRNQGLIRAIFELIHARSADCGHLAQAITGIPYYYRLFGYEYAPDLGGARHVLLTTIPDLKENEAEPYQLRGATLDDLPFVMSMYEREFSNQSIWTDINQAYWRYCLAGHNVESGEGLMIAVILDGNQQAIGYILSRPKRWSDTLPIFGFAVREGISMIAVLPSSLRWLRSYAQQATTGKADSPPVRQLQFMLGRAHPAYIALGDTLAPKYSPPYAWYVRVPDLPALIRQIAPVLEHRLAASVAAGYSGDLKLTFYRGGLRLVFEKGAFVEASDWQAQVWGPKAQAGFPPLVFLQLLFGYRSLSELRHSFPDVWATEAASPLVEALFPPLISAVIPLD